MTFFPMLVNTVTGLAAAGHLERDLMRSYGAGYWSTLLRLRLPAAMPFIFNALKINSTLALIGATSTYALAFFFRPLGGWLLGRFADLRGRKAGMLLTILLMAGGSLVIAILPTYEQVGWLAPILLFLALIYGVVALVRRTSGASRPFERMRVREVIDQWRRR